MKRRDFLKRTGVGFAALVSFLILATTLPTPVWADDEKLSFNFTAVSQRPSLMVSNTVSFCLEQVISMIRK